MPTPSYPKLIEVKFTDGSTSDVVTIKNLTTGEQTNTDHKGNLLRLESRHKSIIYALDNLLEGWTVGDIIEVSITGVKIVKAYITLTAAATAPQTTTVTAIAVSTAVINI